MSGIDNDTKADLIGAYLKALRASAYYKTRYDLPITWEIGKVCFVSDERAFYKSAGPAVWEPLFGKELFMHKLCNPFYNGMKI
jgi:hypothetical protein